MYIRLNGQQQLERSWYMQVSLIMIETGTYAETVIMNYLLLPRTSLLSLLGLHCFSPSPPPGLLKQ